MLGVCNLVGVVLADALGAECQDPKPLGDRLA